MDSSFYKKAKERMEEMRKKNNQDVTRSYRLKTSNIVPMKPTPTEAKILEGNFDQFKPLDPPDATNEYTLQERIERIKSSVERINDLIKEYKALSEKK